MTHMANKNGIQRAVEMFGGSPTRLAEAVGNGVLRQHIEHWLKSGRVSSEKAPEVAAATGIDIKDLNDTTNWVLAGKLMTGKHRCQPATQEVSHG